jgi:hypothetical protein
VTSTVTSYLSKIKQNFPVKGQDNDSQGFRDNFHNIHEAIKYVDANVNLLDQTTIKTNTTSTFGGNTVDSANFKNCSNELYSYALQTDAVNIDYSLGSYQKFELSSGLHDLYIENWPGAGKSGNLKLSVTSVSEAYTAINFLGTTDIGPVQNPYELTPGVSNFFELWNEEDSGNVYVKQINEYVFNNSTSTHVIWVNQLKLGKINDNVSTNVYTTGTGHVTLVKNSGTIAQIALIPNRVHKTLVDANEHTTGGYVTLVFADTGDIYKNAKFNLRPEVGTSTYTVNTITNSTEIKVIPNDFDASNLIVGETFTFINPTFTNQPVVLTLAPTAATTSSGTYTNYVGSVYADANKLEVAYDDYGNGVSNTFTIDTLAVNTATDNSATLASTEFVHNVMPYGAVIMWYGLKNKIPAGWAICDGTNGTPNLVDKFVVGASGDFYGQIPGSTITGNNTSTGGTVQSGVVSHIHTAQFTGDAQTLDHSFDLSHTHKYDRITTSGGLARADNRDSVGWAPGSSTGVLEYTPPSGGKIEPHVVTMRGTINVNAAGTISSSTNYANVPPFYALYYIMKVSGTPHNFS